MNGDQIPSKTAKVTKNTNIYIHGVFISGFGGNWGEKWTWSPLTKLVYILLTYVLLIPRKKLWTGGVLGSEVLNGLTTCRAVVLLEDPENS